MIEEKKEIKITINVGQAFAILFSLFLHLAILLPRFADHVKKANKRPRLVVKQVDSNKMKMVGKEVGKENQLPVFSPQKSLAPNLPQHMQNQPQQQQPSAQQMVQKPSKPTKEKLTLAQKMARILEENTRKGVAKNNPEEAQKDSEKSLDFNKNTPVKAIKRAQYSGQNLANIVQQSSPMGRSPLANQLINKSDLFIQLETPKGVKEDELNKEEQMLYSFHRRMVESYINALLHTLQNFRSQHPYLNNFPFTGGLIQLTAKVTFDQLGNIKQIKMVRWTHEEKVQEFFLQALDDIKSLPNPPKMILEGSNEFSVYYGLTING